MFLVIVLKAILFSFIFGHSNGATPKFAPFFDTFLEGRTNKLTDVYQKTGQKDFHLAFVLGTDCTPKWGARYDLNDPIIMDDIRAIQAVGGQFFVATGGALGPYIEHSCLTVEDLVRAYKTALDTVGTDHLDIDVEASIDFDRVNQALVQLQKERPQTTVSFTLAVQSDDYGLTPILGVELLKHAKKTGVNVEKVNAMLMEFYTAGNDWGEAVINAAEHVLLQLKDIWPEKSDAEIRKMFGACPLLGQNFNGKKFELEHGRELLAWAKENEIGLITFWSVERDNGKCAGDPIVSPYCSGIVQSEFEFTKMFQEFSYLKN